LGGRWEVGGEMGTMVVQALQGVALALMSHLVTNALIKEMGPKSSCSQHLT
jgi:hypothetical protein